MNRGIAPLALAVLSLALLATPDVAQGWNLGAKHINALSFFKDGRIRFTLFEEGSSGSEFRCSSGARGQWFFIPACDDGDAACLRRMDRIASMLLAAKLADRPVHVERSDCEVSEVALKP